jgi:hypothetical protein
MSHFSPFEIQKHSFSTMLAGLTAEVPDLQRPFAWSEEQANDLCLDVLALVDEIKGHPGTSPQHFIGSIVTISGVGRSRVIDGQQRMTTITLLLGLIGAAISQLGEKISKSKGEPERKQELMNRVNGLTTEVKTLLWYTGFEGEELRFKPSPEIEKTYSSFIKGGDGKIPSETRAPAENLRNIAKLLNKNLVKEKSRFDNLEDIHQIDHLQRLYNAVAKCLIFVRIDTASSTAGYQLFESLNATGKPLNALDLLKVWMLATLAGSEHADSVAEQFRELSNDDENEARNFVVDYYRAKTFSNAGKPSAKALSMLLRGHLFLDPDVPEAFRSIKAEKDGLEARIANHVTTMTQWQPTWKSITKGVLPYDVPDNGFAFQKERFHELVNGSLKHTLPVPLFMQAAVHLSLDDFCKMTHLIERVFFRYKTICNGPVGKLEEVYQWATEVLDTNKTLDLGLLAQKLQALIDAHCPDDVFLVNLRVKLIYPTGAGRIKYFLQMLDLYETNPAPAKLALNGLKFTIEHVDPQNPNDPRQIMEEKLHTIGNLCLLTPPENGVAGNRMFPVKKQLLNNGKGCSSLLTQRVLATADWNDAEVDKREALLMEKAMNVFTATVK